MRFEPRRADGHPAPAPRLAAALAAAAVAAAGVGLYHEAGGGRDAQGAAQGVAATLAEKVSSLTAGKARDSAVEAPGAREEDVVPNAGERRPASDEEAPRPAETASTVDPALADRLRELAASRSRPTPLADAAVPATAPAPAEPETESSEEAFKKHAEKSAPAATEQRAARRRMRADQGRDSAYRQDIGPSVGAGLTREGMREGEGALAQGRQNRAPGRSGAGRLAGTAPKGAASAAPEPSQTRRPPVPADAVATARHYLAARESLEGLAFQDAAGYWSNTYVPGDPVLRVLAARLARASPDGLPVRLGTARPNWQPFDAPQDAALALYASADEAAIEGRARLRVQVGLQATERRSGQRPAMNVGVVLDLRGPRSPADALRMRALVAALARARRPGDRFSLTVAGRGDGLLVSPPDFRHGPLQLAMQRLFGDAGERAASGPGLLSALRTAAREARRGDDPGAPLGASLVLLVSTSPLGGERAAIERLVHDNAVAGVTLSAVTLGRGADLAQLDGLVLLGQGHRRVLASPEDAERLVDEELHASSRAVARAVRLRIRLAPGVRLVEVLGAQRLAEPQARRVREAESSIDQRLARNLGIRADRGEDEEGVQIVIPSFFAGDTHVVLLDVVTEGPGPVADVKVRYKDVVYRRNGVASTRLDVDGGRRPPGPLERNVLKNELAHVFAEAVRSAAARLAAGDRRGALRELRETHMLVSGMRRVIPAWQRDPELRYDETLLARFLTVLQSAYAKAPAQREHLADALRYTAHRRLVPAWE